VRDCSSDLAYLLTFVKGGSSDILMKPLGKILEEAGLIHQNQLQVVLMEQNTYSHLKIGEILALHGWLKQETADFFAETIQQPVKKEIFDLQIGEFFNQAGLLSKKDIENILSEQKKTGIKFGSIAVLKGLIKRQTLDFFLKNFTLKTNERTDFQDRDKDTLTQRRLSLQTQNKSYLSIYYNLAIACFTKASSVTNKSEKLEILQDFRNLYLKIEKLQTRNDQSMGKLPKYEQERLDRIYISVLAELAKFD
jgi:hypothetical protein